MTHVQGNHVPDYVALGFEQIDRDLHFLIECFREVLTDLGQRYELGGDRGLLQDYCPTCKRVLRANAYYALMKRDFL